jgi:D-3-phosphoglycerate dehydrogenase
MYRMASCNLSITPKINTFEKNHLRFPCFLQSIPNTLAFPVFLQSECSIMRPPKLLVADEFPQSFIESIQYSGWGVRYLPGATEQTYLTEVRDSTALLLNSAIRVDRSFLDAAPELKLVLRAGVGADHIDMPELGRRGIQFINTPGANAQAVGEMALGLLLVLLRNIRKADAEIRNFSWIREANRGNELSSLSVGIIGFGNTGKAFARVLSGFGCQILAYDKYQSGFGNSFVKESTLEEIQQEADVLSFHIPLTEETRSWGTKNFFYSFSKSIYLLNLSRGLILNTTDLPSLLDDGKILGVGLDVLANEKFDTLTQEQTQLYTNLFSRSNVIFTPHIGGWTFNSADNIQQTLLNALSSYLLQSKL